MPRKNKKKLLDSALSNLATQQPDEEELGKVNRSFKMRRSQALDYLSGSNMPSKFKFRQSQIDKIKAFLQTCVEQKKKGYRFMMVTGSPGAGKTLCINTILNNMKIQVIMLNANIVKSIVEVQLQISRKLLNGQQYKSAINILRQVELGEKLPVRVVYIEEIQLLFKSAPDLISQDFMSLFSHKKSGLILIGISNTINTLQKYSSKFYFKMSEIDNVVFQPYTTQQISCILKEKIQVIEKRYRLSIDFPEKLLKFASQKLQTLKKGDFRICLQFLKQTIKNTLYASDQQKQIYTIELKTINKTFQKMTISKNQLIQRLPYQQKLLLIALTLLITKTEALLLSVKEMQSELKWICGSLQVTFSPNQLEESLRQLQQYGFVQIKKKNNETKAILNISVEEVKNTFQENQLFKKFFVNNQ